MKGTTLMEVKFYNSLSYQNTNFTGNKNKMISLAKKIPDKFERSKNNVIERFLGVTLVKLEPAKGYKELNSILKKCYMLSKFDDFSFKLANLPLLLVPKKFRTSSYNAQEFVDKGYEFVQNNKDKLDVLTYETVHSKNSDYLKGMLKATKELGLSK